MEEGKRGQGAAAQCATTARALRLHPCWLFRPGHPTTAGHPESKDIAGDLHAPGAFLSGEFMPKGTLCQRCWGPCGKALREAKYTPHPLFAAPLRLRGAEAEDAGRVLR